MVGWSHFLIFINMYWLLIPISRIQIFSILILWFTIYVYVYWISNFNIKQKQHISFLYWIRIIYHSQSSFKQFLFCFLNRYLDIFQNHLVNERIFINYLALFVCYMIIPIVNTSSVSQALISYEIDFIYYMVSSGIFGIAVKHLKKNEHPIVVILLATIAEDLIINLLCDIKFITYIIQIALIIIFALYTKYKNKNVAY